MRDEREQNEPHDASDATIQAMSGDRLRGAPNSHWWDDIRLLWCSAVGTGTVVLIAYGVVQWRNDCFETLMDGTCTNADWLSVSVGFVAMLFGLPWLLANAILLVTAYGRKSGTR
jgi:hypothetical protein